MKNPSVGMSEIRMRIRVAAIVHVHSLMLRETRMNIWRMRKILNTIIIERVCRLKDKGYDTRNVWSFLNLLFPSLSSLRSIFVP